MTFSMFQKDHLPNEEIIVLFSWLTITFYLPILVEMNSGVKDWCLILSVGEIYSFCCFKLNFDYINTEIGSQATNIV
jgi:hypothetical protein